MNIECQHKLDRLKTLLRETGGCAIAYSGGVDSSLLVTVAHEVLGAKALAVIATSSTYPEREYRQALQLVEDRKIPHVVIRSEELEIPGFRDNPPDRCYYCKKELFTKVKDVALAHGLQHVADGSNADDVHDYRPGLRAANEIGVLSPLKMAGLTKPEIRELSRHYQLPTADKPAMACLSSRFPYGSAITPEKLNQVEAVENFLIERGFTGFRARHHGSILRLEVPVDQMDRMLQPPFRTEFVTFAKAQGFHYVTLDLEGYRTGSLNEVLRDTTIHEN